MRAPGSRGAVSAAVIDVLLADPDAADGPLERLREATDGRAAADALLDEDLQLALFLLYEQHYTGMDAASERWEWDSRLIAARRTLERLHESELTARVTIPGTPEAEASAVAETLFALTTPTPGPSLARAVAADATADQLREFLILRSIYTLKEADPHSWGIPRLRGRPKAALVEVQSDEYGGGRPERVHATMFARAMRAAGLDDAYGAYLDAVPAATLASMNTMSMFGLHRRWIGALCGHLAAFEMTSSLPSRMVAKGVRRLGFGDEVAAYFDEHVEADAVHEQVAARDLAGGLAEQQPELVEDILFGAAACLLVDGLAAEHARLAWAEDRSALRDATVGV
ncbi:iron-containing redox enzyme family protein [Microcella alkalica]|nr:iron-containing redox enzyme family protein [Microcella alkalica]